MTLDRLSRFAPQMLGLLRIVAALTFLEHGTQKLLGFPAMMRMGGPGGPGGGGGTPGGGGGPGSDMGSMGLLFMAAGVIELVGGTAILIGLFTRPIAFILAGELAVIFWAFHVPMGGIFPIGNGGEAAVLYCFTFLYLVAAGPGAFSIDGWIAKRKQA